MIDRAEIERAAVLFRAPEGSFERLLRRRDRKRRNQRIGAGALAIIIALVSFVALTRAFSASTRPADEPVPKPPGIFSGVGGWIVYGDQDGIWAVDPTRPDDPNSQIQLSTETGAPLAWSSDGSKLLILRRNSGSVDLFVLNADGTETYLATSKRYVRGAAKSNGDRGGSFSPDGSQVIYANRSSIYVVDAHGGTPRVLRTASRRWFDIQGLRVQALAYNPTYSPDGTQIAYFDGAGASREGLVHQLRVMNADGSDTRILVDDLEADTAWSPDGDIYNLAWSPDGERLAFGLRSKGIYVVGADGSGLTLAIPGGAYPYWSPDGTRIAFANLAGSGTSRSWTCGDAPACPSLGTLEIAALDGTHVLELGYGEPGPWNPLVQPEPEVAEVPAASDGLILTSSLLMVALLVLVVGAVLMRRRHDRVPR